MLESRHVLVTGGAGYIGSTICSALEKHGYVPIILDSLVSGSREFTQKRAFFKGDFADEAVLERILASYPLTACIHCAARTVVPESVRHPDLYYEENVAKPLKLFTALAKHGCRRIILSSSAAVYGDSGGESVSETASLDPKSPFARSKLMVEQILSDFAAAGILSAITLRYFNPIGADPEMRSGPYHPDPSNILGRLVMVAKGHGGDRFQIAGNDWPTRDGTSIRDYVHVWDLALAHCLALERFDEAMAATDGRCLVLNLGSGQGVTVQEFVGAFEHVIHRKIAAQVGARRPGDISGAYANSDFARKTLGWIPTLTIETAISDALRWHEYSFRMADAATLPAPAPSSTLLRTGRGVNLGG